jgi:simple sugar transport system ATP-binding protein
VALAGDNGAGKSTLIKAISGVFHYDEGDIYLDGKRIAFATPQEASDNGIETIYQDLALADNLTIGDNIFLGREPMKKLFGFLPVIDRPHMAKVAQETMHKLDFHVIRLDAPVSAFSGGQRQAVAIGRAMYWNARLVIMDEPTAALGVPEQRKVIALIQSLKAEGKGIIFISHNLRHFRSGRSHRGLPPRQVGERRPTETTGDEVVRLIVGSRLRPLGRFGQDELGIQPGSHRCCHISGRWLTSKSGNLPRGWARFAARRFGNIGRTEVARMALFDPGPVAFTPALPVRDTKSRWLGNPCWAGVCRTSSGWKPNGHRPPRWRRPGSHRRGGHARLLAELPLIRSGFPNERRRRQMVLEGQQRPSPGVRTARHGALARGGKAVDENRPFHEFRARFVNALRPAPITPARSPSAAGSTGHWYHGARAGKLASA